ncbi:UNVERIFIED_CONTAM: hypothetical protein Scaly_1350400 [Sesamum calycinum]|uniref:Proline-rich protein n=1 Tax=Sesamum calycinum TaxID=2727403 RepID=A0AAW2PLG6_9LAMI
MGFQLKLFSFWVCLLLTLSFCHGKNVTVKVFGLMHCRECIRHDFSSSQESMGINVSISCKSRNRETKPQGNGAVDSEGKFYVALSAEITKHGNPLDGCVAKLQSAAATPCPIQSAQTASVKLLATEENATEAAYNRPTTIQFSPVTCQSAIFWPLPNFTFFPGVSPPTGEPMGFAPPPSEALPPLATSIQPPSPPDGNFLPPPAPASPPSYLPPIPSLPPPPPKFGDPSPPPDVNLGTPPPAPASPPSYLPPIPSLPPPPSEFGDPSPPPDVNFGTPPPAPAPAPASWSQSPQNKPNPTSKGTSRPPIPVYETPLLPPQVQPSNAPIPSPTPKSRKPIRPPFSEHPLQKPPPHSNQLPPPPASPFYQTPYPSPPPVLPAIPPPHGEPRPKTPNAPPPNPQLGKPTPTSPAGSLNPPDQGNPNPIPRAPPVPQLPPIPTVPRKYFNAPKSKSQPPRSSYSSHPDLCSFGAPGNKKSDLALFYI